jgi:hypothetical protein
MGWPRGLMFDSIEWNGGRSAACTETSDVDRDAGTKFWKYSPGAQPDEAFAPKQSTGYTSAEVGIKHIAFRGRDVYHAAQRISDERVPQNTVRSARMAQQVFSTIGLRVKTLRGSGCDRVLPAVPVTQ